VCCLLLQTCAAFSAPAGSSVADFVARADDESNRGHLTDALADYTRALDFGGTNQPEIYLKRANLRRTMRDVDGSLVDYSRAITLAPSNGAAFSERGLARFLKEDFTGAEADGTSAIWLAPRQWPGYEVRAMARYEQQDLDGALADIEVALTYRPKSPLLLNQRGLIKTAEEDFIGALSDFDALIELSGTAHHHYARGRARAESGDLAGALADFTRAIQLDPRFAAAYSQRAHSKAALGDLPGALADFGFCLKNETNGASTYSCRGTVRQNMGDTAGALQDFRLSVEANPTNHYYGSLNLWILRARRGEREEADAELSACLLNSPQVKNSQEWPRKIVEFLLGKISQEALEAAYHSRAPATEHKQQCEYWYFVGMKHLLSGEKPQAMAAFRNCLKTRRRTDCEYRCAQSELHELEK